MQLISRSRRRGDQRGLSLVEMMVGVAVGLIVVAGASMLVSSQLFENRRLLVETQIQQDMRAATDIVTRELRRIGTAREPVALLGLTSAAGSQENFLARNSPTVSGAPVDHLDFHYQFSVGADTFGFRWVQVGSPPVGVVQSYVGASGWQDLTDPTVLDVQTFSILPHHSTVIRLPCARPCADGTTNCWPDVTVRDLQVTMTAVARSDPAVRRTLVSRLRLRNDLVEFNVSSADACPA